MISPFTAAELILIAIFAVITLFGIWWGIKRKREQVKAEAATENHRKALREAHPVSAVPAPPVVPSPPPVVDEPLIAEQRPVADEPIAASAAFDTSPAALAADMVANMPVPETLAGDITQLKGLGPKLAATLAELGITRVDQIAAMSGDELNALDAKLGAFQGRIARDRWAEQARLLTAGDRAAYEAEFGKLGG